MKNPNVKVVGLGEGGARAVSRMMNSHVGEKLSADFVAVGNDENLLLTSATKTNIFLNRDGATVKRQLSEALDGANFIVLAAGLGSTAAMRSIPIILSHAHKHKAQTVAFVNMPSKLEKNSRHENAAHCLSDLAKADSVFAVPAEKFFLFRLNRKEISLKDLFTVADEIFCNGVKNFLDALADEKKPADVLKFGDAAFCYGEAEGIDSTVDALKAALKFPLLDVDELKRAPKIFIRVTGGELFFKTTADAAKKFFRDEVTDTKVIWRVDKDSAIVNKVRASIMFTRPLAPSADKSTFPSLKNLLGRFQP